MTLDRPISRRGLLGRAAAACAAASLPRPWTAARADGADGATAPFPVVDLHVHLDNSSLAQVLPLARERGVRFGIVEHAGTRENQYPIVLSTDAELTAYIERLDGHGVYKGVQAEWIDWDRCFSPEVLARLDYVLTDTMTFPAPDGTRVKLWEPAAPERIDMSDPEAFMDRYVAWHVEVMAATPFDILANATWLPAPLAADYERLWTERRTRTILDAALKYGIAIEISASYELPKLGFLKQARAAGVKFSFGSNGRYPNMGKLDYSLAMARALDLGPDDLFTPAPDGRKAVQRRRRA